MLKKLFRRKKGEKSYMTVDETAVYMASIGISPDKIMEYKELTEALMGTKEKSRLESKLEELKGPR